VAKLVEPFRLIDCLSRIELHRPGIEVTEPPLSPPDLVHVLIDGQEPDDLTTQDGADEHMFVAPCEFAVNYLRDAVGC
jgi:hypothetical protein